MGVYSDRLDREVRLERMRPEQVKAAKERLPAIYAAFGSVEWHGRHNPVGLDTIKAHEQLVALAQRVGGVVYPPVFLGAGGGHTEWPHSFMVGAAPMQHIVAKLLAGFDRDGYRKAILLSGHYPNRREYLDPAVEAYRRSGGRMDVLALVETEFPGGNGDHAALYETSLMLHLHPDTVDATALEVPAPDAPPTDTDMHNWMAPECRDHPCYGLVGRDPRGTATAGIGRELTEKLIAYLEAWVRPPAGHAGKRRD